MQGVGSRMWGESGRVEVHYLCREQMREAIEDTGAEFCTSCLALWFRVTNCKGSIRVAIRGSTEYFGFRCLRAHETSFAPDPKPKLHARKTEHTHLIRGPEACDLAISKPPEGPAA